MTDCNSEAAVVEGAAMQARDDDLRRGGRGGRPVQDGPRSERRPDGPDIRRAPGSRAAAPSELVEAVEKAVRERGGDPAKRESTFTCPIPTHHQNGDAHASARWNNGKKAWWCPIGNVGGGYKDLAIRLGILPSDHHRPDDDQRRRHRESSRARRRTVATYDYRDENGVLLYQVVRFKPKGFSQRRSRQPDDDVAALDAHDITVDDDWAWSLDRLEPALGEKCKTCGGPHRVVHVRRVLYRLPELLAADPLATVYVVEGEKDVDALVGLGLVGTTNPQGAGKWRPDYNEHLRDRDVVLLPDHDVTGRDHAEVIACNLAGVARRVRSVALPGLPTKGDVSDWLAAGHTRAELEALVAATGQWTPRPRDRERITGGFPRSEGLQVQPDAVHRTDLGNARRLVVLGGRDFRFCPEGAFGGWLYWDGRRWAPDATAAIMRVAKATTAAMLREAAELEDPRTLAQHALKSQALERLRAMVKLAESERGIPLRQAELDADPWLLNVLNGAINLRTGELQPHRRENLITKLAPVTYDPAATCPMFRGFLTRIFAGNTDLIAFVQRAIGYALTGDVSERVFFILWGTGRNGKTTLLEAVRATLDDYAMRTPAETLMEQRDGTIPNDVARLRGVRFVTASETREGRRLDEARLKDLTGGDTITARFMRAEWFEFRPECKIFLSTNHRPVVRGTDHAIWDRIRLVPFMVRIPDEGQDRQLPAKLRAEGAGILRWAVDGCLAWQSDGLGMPDEVRTATEGYRHESDVLGQFIDECCLVRAGAKARAKDLYAAYTRWCDDSREHAVTQKRFGGALTERGFGRDHDEHGWWRLGIGLLTRLTDPDPEFGFNDKDGPHMGETGNQGQDRSERSGATRRDRTGQNGAGDAALDDDRDVTLELARLGGWVQIEIRPAVLAPAAAGREGWEFFVANATGEDLTGARAALDALLAREGVKP